MTRLLMPDEAIYLTRETVVVFNQLAVKVATDSVNDTEYFDWLDRMRATIGKRVQGAQIAEKEHARQSPPLNIAVYYDTPDYRILPTGALLRTSCNRITHAFCAFKMAQDDRSVRRDHRYVFQGNEKATIQQAPTSPEAIAIVKGLLRRTDIEHPGSLLATHLGIEPESLEPALCLEDLRYTFFVWIDGRDALRCSLDRAVVYDLRVSPEMRNRKSFAEIELAIYPRIEPSVARDSRVVEAIQALRDSLVTEFGVQVTLEIKYQRAASVLAIPNVKLDREPVL